MTLRLEPVIVNEDSLEIPVRNFVQMDLMGYDVQKSVIAVVLPVILLQENVSVLQGDNLPLVNCRVNMDDLALIANIYVTVIMEVRVTRFLGRVYAVQPG